MTIRDFTKLCFEVGRMTGWKPQRMLTAALIVYNETRLRERMRAAGVLVRRCRKCVVWWEG